MKPFSQLLSPSRMTLVPGLVIGLVLVGGLVVWQHFRIVALEESLSALRFSQAADVETGADRGTGPGPGQRPGGELSGAAGARGSGPGMALGAMSGTGAGAGSGAGPGLPDGPGAASEGANGKPTAGGGQTAGGGGADRGREAGGAPEGLNGRMARMRELRSMDRSQRLEAKVLDLTSTLDLTSDQQAAVRAVLESGSAERDAMRAAAMERRRGGTPESEAAGRAEFAKLAASETSESEKIAAVLSAEQLTEYAEYLTRQQQDSVESRANQQLGDLQSRFTLTEEQKDAAFQFFAQQEEQIAAQRSQDPAAAAAAPAQDPVKSMEERQKTRLQAMRKILTPAQYELLRVQEDQRAELFKTMVPGGAPPP